MFTHISVSNVDIKTERSKVLRVFFVIYYDVMSLQISSVKEAEMEMILRTSNFCQNLLFVCTRVCKKSGRIQQKIKFIIPVVVR